MDFWIQITSFVLLVSFLSLATSWPNLVPRVSHLTVPWSGAVRWETLRTRLQLAMVYPMAYPGLWATRKQREPLKGPIYRIYVPSTSYRFVPVLLFGREHFWWSTSRHKLLPWNIHPIFTFFTHFISRFQVNISQKSSGCSAYTSIMVSRLWVTRTQVLPASSLWSILRGKI